MMYYNMAQYSVHTFTIETHMYILHVYIYTCIIIHFTMSISAWDYAKV